MTEVCIHILGSLFACVSYAVVSPLVLVWQGEADGAQHAVTQFLDILYFRSSSLQSILNFRASYGQHSQSGLLENSPPAGYTAFPEELEVVQRLHAGGVTTTKSYQRVAVLLHGMFATNEIFNPELCSLVEHLERAGYEVWVPLQSSVHAGNKRGTVTWHCEVLLALARKLQSTTEHSPKVTWVAHSTACGDLMAALDSSTSNHLLQVTEQVYLLSPVLYKTDRKVSQSGLSAAARRLTTAWKGRASSVPTVRLHEVLLRDPSTCARLLGERRGQLLSSLLAWRDLLAPKAYSWLVITPLARYVLGWSLRNISTVRRRRLLPHLFVPASTEEVVALLQGFQRSQGMPAAARLGVVGTVKDVWRCWWSCAAIALDLTGCLLRSLLGMQDGACGDQPEPPNRVIALPPVGENPAAAVAGRCRVTVVVGDRDALFDPDSVGQALAAYEARVHVVPGYEHMDTLWADSAPQKVFSVFTEL